MSNKRKNDHLELTGQAQMSEHERNPEIQDFFYYEPLFAKHPHALQTLPITFLGRQLDYPFWISSMTGGGENSKKINENLAIVAKKYGLGMGLGSCRLLLDNDELIDDFDLRQHLGGELPFFANLGVHQLALLIKNNQIDKLHRMIEKLRADGLIVHINPLQEWFQIEGDRFFESPLETLAKFMNLKKYPLIVKEVGQGMGPHSLKALIDLQVEGIEFGALGGTNFSKLEVLRKKSADIDTSLAYVGHSALEMVHFLNDLYDEARDKEKFPEIIISGGINDAAKAFHLWSLSKKRPLIGMASSFLLHANQMADLEIFIQEKINHFKMAQSCLFPRDKKCKNR